MRTRGGGQVVSFKSNALQLFQLKDGVTLLLYQVTFSSTTSHTQSHFSRQIIHISVNMERCSNVPKPSVSFICKDRWWDKKVTAPVRTGELVHFPVELYRERLLPTSDFDVNSYSRFAIALFEQLCARHGMIPIPVQTEKNLIYLL
jgi:hypothetical protein